MSKYVDQVSVRLPPELKQELMDVAEYERTKHTDLVRELIRGKVREVIGTRAYQNWLQQRERGGEHEPAV